jgi:hypothetical protein
VNILGVELEVSGPEGILLRSSAVGYWHGEGTAGPSEPIEIAHEPDDPQPRPIVNAPAVPGQTGEPHPQTTSRYRAAELGALLDADRLDGTVVEMDPGEGSEPYHYVHGREKRLLVLAGDPTLRHAQAEEQLDAGETPGTGGSVTVPAAMTSSSASPADRNDEPDSSG